MTGNYCEIFYILFGKLQFVHFSIEIFATFTILRLEYFPIIQAGKTRKEKNFKEIEDVLKMLLFYLEIYGQEKYLHGLIL